MRSLYEGILSDIDDTLSKSDDIVGVLSELAEARKLKSAFFSPDKKYICSFRFDCPTLLNKYLDLKVKHKIASKRLGTPTSLTLRYEYDSERNYYSITIGIHNEHKYCTCLYAKSQWDYSNKATSAGIANRLSEYMLKSEDHFKMMLSLFDSNYISYSSSYKFFEAPRFSAKSLLFGLQRI